MDSKIKETIEKNMQLITDAANATSEINDALGAVIIRASDLSTSGSVLGAARKTLPGIVDQIMYAVNQIKQAMNEEAKPAEVAEPAQEQTETRVASKKK